MEQQLQKRGRVLCTAIRMEISEGRGTRMGFVLSGTAVVVEYAEVRGAADSAQDSRRF